MNSNAPLLALSCLVTLGLIGYLFYLYIKDTNAKPKVGKVESVKQTYRVLASEAVTTLRVSLESGEIYYLGYEGHDKEMEVGDTLEFWQSHEVILFSGEMTNVHHTDGSISKVREHRKYYAMKKFRVIKTSE